MITIGVDAHKRVHVALAVDEAGCEIGRWQGPNSPVGWHGLAEWALGLDSGRRWGIEGAWGYGRGLAQQLVTAGEAVFEVNARWTALGRRSARRLGKTDRLDALAIALLVRQEASTLPPVFPEDHTALLDLLCTEREGALAEATRLRNQIHALLLQLDPEYQACLPSLKSQAGLAVLETYAAPGDSPLQQARAATVRRLAQRLRLALTQAEELANRIGDSAAADFSPLTRLCGVSLLTAGTLAGILGPGHRFATDAQLAAYAGVAPLEASSAGHVRHRLNRGGNRRLNAILYRIALTQARHSVEARAYLDRRVAEGKTRREAIRALKRFIIRAIWRLWQECRPINNTTFAENAA
jgi:transposase